MIPTIRFRSLSSTANSLETHPEAESGPPCSIAYRRNASCWPALIFARMIVPYTSTPPLNYPQAESNRRFSLERAVSWPLDDGGLGGVHAIKGFSGLIRPSESLAAHTRGLPSFPRYIPSCAAVPRWQPGLAWRLKALHR